jgi:hypothetical protein
MIRGFVSHLTYSVFATENMHFRFLFTAVTPPALNSEIENQTDDKQTHVIGKYRLYAFAVGIQI